MVRAARAAERTGSLATASVSGVATNPGVIALQHTPLPAQASDWDRVSPVRPALDAPYPPLLPNARTACWEATLMIRPQPRRAIAGPKHWPSTNGAVRFTVITSAHCSRVCSPSGGRGLAPAALTRMSGSPYAETASPAARWAAAGSARSARTQAAVPPADWMAAAALRRPSSPRARRTTRAPARARARAMACPMPELPPVIRATRPSRENRPSRNAARGPGRGSESGPGTDHAESVRGQAAAAAQCLEGRLLVQPGGEEAGAERIAGPGAVHERVDRQGEGPDRVGAPVGEQRPVGGELHHDLRIPGGQHVRRGLRVFAAGEHRRLIRVDQEQGHPVGHLEERLGSDPLQRRSRGAVHGDRHAGPPRVGEGRQGGARDPSFSSV